MKSQKKDTIEEIAHEQDEYISNIFTKSKEDGIYRIILDLASLNMGLEYNPFRMDFSFSKPAN